MRTNLYNTLNYLPEENIRNNFQVERFTSKLYYSYLLNHNLNWNNSIIQKQKIHLFDTIVDTIRVNSETMGAESTLPIIVAELRLFTKTLIDNHENDVLNKTLTRLISNPRYISQNNDLYLSLLSIIIYLIYISEKEKLTPEELKISSKEYLKYNNDDISYLLFNFDIDIITKENVNFIKNNLASWELMPDGEFKTMILDEYINSFLIYLSLYIEKDNEKLKKALSNIVQSNSFHFVNKHTGDLQKKSIDNYKLMVLTLFNDEISDYQVNEDFDRLKDLLFDMYKQDELLKGNSTILSEENKKILEEEIHSAFIDLISTNFNIFNNAQDSLENYSENTLEDSMNLSTKYIETYISKIAEISLISFFGYFVSNMIDEEKLFYDKLEFGDKQALVKLFNSLDTLNFNVDTILGYRDWFYSFDRVADFEKLVENMTKIKIPGINNIVLLLNKSKLIIQDLTCNIAIEDVDFDEFIKTLTIDEDGKYLYNITNDIFLPFDKIELIEHIKNTHKRVRYIIKYKYTYTGGKIGAAIIFKTKF